MVIFLDFALTLTDDDVVSEATTLSWKGHGALRERKSNDTMSDKGHLSGQNDNYIIIERRGWNKWRGFRQMQ